VKCLFAAVKRATVWPDERLMAIVRLWVLRRHSGWATDTVVGDMSVAPGFGTLIVAGPL